MFWGRPRRRPPRCCRTWRRFPRQWPASTGRRGRGSSRRPARRKESSRAFPRSCSGFRKRRSSRSNCSNSGWNRSRRTVPSNLPRPSRRSSRDGRRRSRIPARRSIDAEPAQGTHGVETMSAVIDVHTHCLTEAWFQLLQQHGAPRYTVEQVRGGLRAIHLDGAPFMTPVPAMFDYDLRLVTMNEHGVDICIVSLTCPNCYWGGPEVSLEAARLMNDDMAAAQTAHPDRLRWFASLPWQHEALALAELKRAVAAGASGVMVLANIDGKSLTDPAFASIWSAIDAYALPVLVHPSAPPGVADMDMTRFQLTASIGFTFDTSLAVARMIYDGFFDRYPELRIIAGHGGGALPYLISRMDQCFDNIPACREKISVRPSEYLPKIYADSVVFSPGVLELCVKTFGADNVIYGSDYPHTIGDMPGCLKRVNGLAGNARDKVRGRNAQRVFGL